MQTRKIVKKTVHIAVLYRGGNVTIRDDYGKEKGVDVTEFDKFLFSRCPACIRCYVEYLESRVEGKGDGWISVKERLPDDAKSVLIFFDRHMSIGSHINDTWYCIDGTFHEVTHWMKPQPPAGQGD